MRKELVCTSQNDRFGKKFNVKLKKTLNYLTENPQMTINHLEEGEIKKLIKRYPPDSQFYDYRPKDFIAYQVNGEWRITFTYLDKAGYELHIKREGIKGFGNLTTVGNCLRRMGIAEFKAIL